VEHEEALLHMCATLELPEEWKAQDEILVVQIWMCESHLHPLPAVELDIEAVL
jgi:hypothetical protein